MNRRFLFAMALAAAAPVFSVAFAQAVAPNNTGDIFRACRMLDDRNPLGTVDQLALIDAACLTPAQAERAAWLECVAQSQLNADRAAHLLAGFLKSYGASAERFRAVMLLADCLLDENPAKAYELYCEVPPSSLTDAQRSELAYHKGYALLMTGRNSEAKQCFAQAAVNPWRSRAGFYQGYIAYADHDYAAAKQLLEAADRSALPGSLADFYLAQIHYAEGDYNRSLALARSLAGRKDVPAPFLAEAARVAGESMFQLGDSKGAASQLRRYIGMTDESARSALYILGVLEFNSAKNAETVELLRRVVDADDADALAQSAYLYIGQALMAQADRDAAIVAFDNALRMYFDKDVQEAAFYNYAVAKSAGARVPFGSSAATFEEFLAKFPDGKHAAAVQEYLVDGYLTGGDYDQALASINRMVKPTEKVLDAKQKVLYIIGSRALAVNDVDKAVAALREARAMKGRDWLADAQVSLALGEALARRNDHREAVGLFNEYLAVAPAADVNRDVALYDLGYSYFALKDYANAAKQFKKLAAAKSGKFQSAPLQADVLNRLADSNLYLGNFDEAAKLYAAAFDTNPAAGDYPLYQAAVIQGYGRQHRQKIATLEKFLDLFPSSSLVPDALLQITESQIQLGDDDGAIATYRRLVAEYPSTEQGRRGYLQMALTLLNSRRRAEAIDAYKDVITLYPSSEEAAMALDELKRIYADDGNLGELARWLATVDGAPALDIAQADRLTFEAAEKAWITRGDISRMTAYLEEFPAGSYRVKALGYLAENAVNSGNSADIITFTTQIIDNYPDSPQAVNAIYHRAAALYDLGRSADALESWLMLEQRASTPQMLNEARAGIMRSALEIGENDRVIAAADALLASSAVGPDVLAEAQFSRSLALAHSGREADAVEAWTALAENPADIFGAKSAYYLAEHYFKAGDIKRAHRQADELIASGTPHAYWLARAFILMSDIYAAEGKDFESREYLKSLRANYPGTEADIFEMIDERLHDK